MQPGCGEADLATVAPQRYHWYRKVGSGSAVQVPSLAVIVEPTLRTIAPVDGAGIEEFCGPEFTITVLAVNRFEEPNSLVIVTALKTYLPTSAGTKS